MVQIKSEFDEPNRHFAERAEQQQTKKCRRVKENARTNG